MIFRSGYRQGLRGEGLSPLNRACARLSIPKAERGKVRFTNRKNYYHHMLALSSIKYFTYIAITSTAINTKMGVVKGVAHLLAIT